MKKYLIATGVAGALIAASTAVSALSSPMAMVTDGGTDDRAVAVSLASFERDAGVTAPGRDAGPLVMDTLAAAPVALRHSVPDRLAASSASEVGSYNAAISSVTSQAGDKNKPSIEEKLGNFYGTNDSPTPVSNWVAPLVAAGVIATVIVVSDKSSSD